MKTALITGASRGIGEATAYQLAKEYDCVAIMSRNTDGKLNAVANQIHTTTNCECIPFTGDVSDFAFVEDCVRSLATSGHPVDTLVNNAGISLVGLFDTGGIRLHPAHQCDIRLQHLSCCHSGYGTESAGTYPEHLLGLGTRRCLLRSRLFGNEGCHQQPDDGTCKGTCPKPYRGQCDCFRCRGHDHERSSVCRREEDALRGNPGRKNGGSRRSRRLYLSYFGNAGLYDRRNIEIRWWLDLATIFLSRFLFWIYYESFLRRFLIAVVSLIGFP